VLAIGPAHAIGQPTPQIVRRGGEALVWERPAIALVAAAGNGWQGGMTTAAPRSDAVSSSRQVLPEPGLLRAAQHGDGRAFARLFNAHDRELRSLAFRILGDRQEMDDALQDVALKAFAALPGFRAEASFGTWLYRITYTTCLNRLRGRSLPLPLDDDIGAGEAADDDPADLVLQRIELAAALASLSPEQRAVVALVLEEGLDHATAADILDIPAGTVASRLAAARAVLRACLRGPSNTGDGP